MASIRNPGLLIGRWFRRLLHKEYGLISGAIVGPVGPAGFKIGIIMPHCLGIIS